MARRIYKKSKSEGKIAHKITTVDGMKFHSKMESDYYLHLKQLKADGKILDFELQPKFLLQEKFIIVDGQTILGSHPDFNKLKKKSKAETIRAIEYIADFKVYHVNGDISIEDTKGQSTTEFEIKKKLFLMKYPMLSLKIIIKDDNGLVSKDDWVDFYEYKSAERARKRARALAKKEKEANKKGAK